MLLFATTVWELTLRPCNGDPFLKGAWRQILGSCRSYGCVPSASLPPRMPANWSNHDALRLLKGLVVAYRSLVFTVNLLAAHWVVVEILRPQLDASGHSMGECEVLIYDSVKVWTTASVPALPSQAVQLAQTLYPGGCKWKAKFVVVPQQPAGSNMCGIYASCFAEALARSTPLPRSAMASLPIMTRKDFYDLLAPYFVAADEV